jgi:hypothetical protein
MLEHSGYRTPTKVNAHGFLTVNGEKMSKSRGTFITARAISTSDLNPEWLRYYYAAKLNGSMEDIDLNLDDFVARVNSAIWSASTSTSPAVAPASSRSASAAGWRHRPFPSTGMKCRSATPTSHATTPAHCAK